MSEANDSDIWAQLHARLEVVDEAIRGGRKSTEEERRAILRRRAAEVAREPAAPSDRGATEVLAFIVGQETYGVERSFVREVLNFDELTPVPGAPDFIAGIMNLRGTMLTLFDIRKFFDLPATGLVDLHKIITIRHPTMHIGLLADALPGLRTFHPEELQPTLPTLTGRRADYLKGVLPDLIVLDMEAILSDERLVVNQA